jgi:glycosyltransferase involved in cell wall biosynthesis
LLPFAVLYKLLTGTVVIYDLQENYFFNLHYQEHYSFFTRHLAAYAVRFFEKNLIRFVDAAFLAESCYAEEIKYLPEKSILLENKVFRSENFEKLTAYERKNDALNFVISGTLTQTYGTKEGIKFFMELKKKFRFDGKLYVCGYAPDKNYRKEITELCKSEDVVADISASPLPHEKILKVWARCQICLMPYLKNKAIENRIPTKFYEAMAAGKIILTTRNQAREKKFAQCPAFVFYDDANTPEIETVFQATFEKCKEPDFFFDEEKLIAFVKSLNTSNKKRI